MILHMGHDLPTEETKELDSARVELTKEETRIIKTQIRKNQEVIDGYIKKIDLFVNGERHATRENIVRELRRRLFILMEENDTFRNVFWKHYNHSGDKLI